jgi:hypothetical protein
MRLVISSSYHTYISSILNSLFYNITYMSWFATSYDWPFVMVLVWSYHWWSRYSFVLVLLWEWSYNSPQYISRYYCSYCFEEWSTCSKGGLPPFPSPHVTMSGYFYHHKWLPHFDGHCHCWPDLHKYGAINIDEDNTCSDDGCLGEDIIICWRSTWQWFHSLCYWDVWMFSFLFWFIIDCLCTYHYCASLAVFFSSFDVCSYYQQCMSIAL